MRYAIEGDPIWLAVCHCTECQRQSGSAFGMSLGVSAESFRILQGAVKKFTRSSDSGRSIACAFCPECGTRLFHEPAYAPGAVNVKPGTLDDTSWLRPMAHAWTSSKQPWVPIPEGVPCFEKQP